MLLEAYNGTVHSRALDKIACLRHILPHNANRNKRQGSSSFVINMTSTGDELCDVEADFVFHSDCWRWWIRKKWYHRSQIPRPTFPGMLIQLNVCVSLSVVVALDEIRRLTELEHLSAFL